MEIVAGDLTIVLWFFLAAAAVTVVGVAIWFRIRPREDYGSMNIQERLFLDGPRPAFDDALARRDRAAMLAILKRVRVDGVAEVVDALLTNAAPETE